MDTANSKTGSGDSTIPVASRVLVSLVHRWTGALSYLRKGCSMGNKRAIEWEPKGLLNCRRQKGERAIKWEPKGLLNVAIGGKVERSTQAGVPFSCPFGADSSIALFVPIQ
ncbi:hypothetical protein M513_10914 [Trichuris suis]|uniref:Uncharacterized protein n=1 Tax=Trichuris suis TaxID=68888 RepID=A0A085LTA4_9BILA|nr:hypothetical protein M513_10914 [Trichuris suis]